MNSKSKPIQTWSSMTADEKLDLLNDVLTMAATNITIRDRCLASAESAKAVFAELKPDVIFPEDFRIQFAPEHETGKTTNRLLLKIPPYFGPDAVPPIEAEEYVLCTYMIWREGKYSSPAPRAEQLQAR